MMAWNRIETVELVKMGIFCMCLKDRTNKIYCQMGYGK